MSRPRHTPADEPYFLVRTLGGQVGAGAAIGRHAHGWGQLVYCSAGVMTVWTEAGMWVAPPHWAIWVPAGVAHAIRFAGAATFSTLYLRGDVAAGLAPVCAVAGMSPLLRELVLRAVALGMLDDREPAHRAMTALIVDELAPRATPPLQLTTPASPALKAAAERAAQDGGWSTRRLAAEVGLSPRTLERRFQAETGLGVAAWGRQARMLEALRRLAAGASVKAVAPVAGYASPSAFVAAFRGAFGRTPARYFTDA